MIILKLFMLSSVFYGSVKTASVAWGLGDVGVGIMAWLNIIGILIIFFMSKPAIKALEDYEAQKSQGVKEYIFDPNSLQINNAIFWENRKRNSD